MKTHMYKYPDRKQILVRTYITYIGNTLEIKCSVSKKNRIRIGKYI